MGLIYHAALENSLIMCFMDSRLWNAPLPVFGRLVNASKMKSRIFKNRNSRIKATNRDSPRDCNFTNSMSDSALPRLPFSRDANFVLACCFLSSHSQNTRTQSLLSDSSQILDWVILLWFVVVKWSDTQNNCENAHLGEYSHKPSRLCLKGIPGC